MIVLPSLRTHGVATHVALYVLHQLTAGHRTQKLRATAHADHGDAHLDRSIGQQPFRHGHGYDGSVPGTRTGTNRLVVDRRADVSTTPDHETVDLTGKDVSRA
jgi:hypothetical protein